MTPMRRHCLRSLALLASLAASAPGRATSGYPHRPVRLIVPFPPGGATDVFSRLIAQKLGERLGQPFFVENIAGAGGSAGTGQAARAAPDGHTVLIAFGSFVVNPSLYDKVPYDPYKDFDPVTLAVSTTTVLIAHPSVPATSVPALVDLIKASPGKFSYASGGFGTQPHLTGEQFRLAYGLDVVHVPLAGAGPGVLSVVAGHTPIGFSSLAAVLPQVHAGKLRALAVTSSARSASLPDVPTMAEIGQASILGDSWVGVLVPAGTPPDIVALLHDEIVRSIAQPDTMERLKTLGYEPIASTPQAFSTRIRTESDVWARVIRASNIKVN